MDKEKRAIVVTVGTATVKIRPVGFALYAEEFFIAGASIPEWSQAKGNTTFTPVPYYLMGRALELILKAYLLTEGWPETKFKVRKYGHNLETLWDEANASGLLAVLGAMSSNFQGDLVSLNAYYCSKHLEYFDFHRWAHNYQELPPLPRLVEEVRKVVEKTKRHVFSVS